IRPPSSYGKCHQDRVIVGSMHRLRNRLLRIGDDAVIDVAQIDFVSIALPAHDSVAQSLPAIADADGGPSDLSHPEKLFVQFALGDLVIIFILNLMHREYALLGLGIFGDDLLIRLWLLRRRSEAGTLEAGRDRRLFLRRLLGDRDGR